MVRVRVEDMVRTVFGVEVIFPLSVMWMSSLMYYWNIY